MFEDHFFPEDEDSIPMTNSIYTLFQFLDHSYHESYRDYIYEMNHNFETIDDFGVVCKEIKKYKKQIRYIHFIETIKELFDIG